MAYIVVVEDNEDVAEVVSDALRSEGHRCFVIRSKAARDASSGAFVPISSCSIACWLEGTGYSWRKNWVRK
jgi:CheY-like chemotaxis protein